MLNKLNISYLPYVFLSVCSAFSASIAVAQSIRADNTVVTAPVGSYSGEPAFYAVNGGTINTIGPVTLLGGAHVEAGGTINLLGGTVNACDNGSFNCYGLSTQGAGSTIDATDVTLTISRDDSVLNTGIYAGGIGAVVRGKNLNIFVGNNSNGANNTGISAYSGSIIDIDGGTIVSGSSSGTVGGAINPGVTVDGTGTVVRLNRVSISTADPASTGVSLQNEGSFSLTDGSITTKGFHSLALFSIGNNTNSMITNSQITTTGDSSSAIVTLGGNDDNSPNITLANSTVSTVGTESFGVYSQADSHVSLSNTFVATTGGQSSALYVSGAGARISQTGGTISTSGDGSHGIYSRNGESVEVSGIRMSVSGPNSHSVLADNPAGNQVVQQVSVNNSTLNAAAGDTLRAESGAQLAANFENVVASNGSGFVINALDNSDITLKALNSTFVGTINADVDSVAIANLSNSRLTGTSVNAERIALTDGSIWTVTGNSDTNFLVNDASTIAFASPASGGFKTLTVSSDYASNGGTISLNTYLGGDGSATDLLHVKGNTSGTSNLIVTNAGGPGAPTSEGIRVVQVDGISNGVFRLQSPYVHNGQAAVVAGAYAYKLYKNGISDPSDGDWYLRSQLQNPLAEPGAQAGENPSSQPLYQAGVPVYEAYPQFLLGLNGLPTLQQRVGNRYWDNASNRPAAKGAATSGTPDGEAGSSTGLNGAWARIEGGYTRVDPRYSTASATYDYNTFKLQAGFDGMLHESERGNLIWGVAVHYTRGWADIRSPHDADNGGGKIGTEGSGVGATLTWYGKNGFYLDGQAQATWYRSDLSYDGGGRSLVKNNDGFGYALSLEGGQRIAVGQGWSLTPQAQLVYSSVDFDAFDDSFRARVSLDRGDSLQGRLGLAVERQESWYNSRGTIDRLFLYGIGNLYHEFLDGTKVDVSGTSLINRNERLWGGLGIGGSYNWDNDKYSLYGEGSINTSLANFGDSYALKGRLGFRMKW